MAIGTTAAILGGASLLGSAIGGKKSSGGGGNPARSLGYSQEVLDRYNSSSDDSGVRGQMAQFSQLANMFGSESSRSYLDTTEGKSFTSMIEKASKRRKGDLDRSSSLLGLSSESYLAGLGQINEAEGDSMNQLVSGADARRNSLRSQQMAALSQVLGGEQGLYGAQQNRFSNAYGLGNQMYQADMQRKGQSNQNLMGLFGQIGSAALPFILGGK